MYVHKAAEISGITAVPEVACTRGNGSALLLLETSSDAPARSINAGSTAAGAKYASASSRAARLCRS
jgi:hypothetical protein